MANVTIDTEMLRDSMQGSNGVKQHANNIKNTAQNLNRISDLLATSCKCRSTIKLVDSIGRMQNRVCCRADKLEHISDTLTQVADNYENTEHEIISKIKR